MSLQKAAQFLRKSIDDKVLPSETDTGAVERLTKARSELEFAMKLLEERRPAIPLDD